MVLNIIIGKNSNLSNTLSKRLNNCVLISSREILKDINILSKYKDKKINIIFNNFQPATQLNNLDNMSDYITNSILITAKVLDYFKKTDINKIIYTSSSSVYGNNILCKESDELKPMNLHASLKVTNEKLIQIYCSDNNIDYTITRIFNMYGGNDKFSVISKLLDAYKNDKELSVVNNGNAIRDFIHINDVVLIYIKLLEIKKLNILNIGTGEGTSVKSLLSFLSNNGINIKTKNIFKDELKISTSNNRLLMDTFKNDTFIDVEKYLINEFQK